MSSASKHDTEKRDKDTKIKSAKPSTLSRDRIVEAAYEIAREHPSGALSMRKIASHLNVTPMAIYKYFNDKAELTAAIIDVHMTRSHLIPDSVATSDWREWVRDAFLRMWDAFEDAPTMLQYMSDAVSFGPAALSWHNHVLKVLIQAGLTPEQALIGHAAMSELAAGSATLIPIRSQGVERAFPQIWNAMQSDQTEALEEYQWIMQCGPAMLENMQDSRNAFLKEIELIISSLAAQIESNREH